MTGLPPIPRPDGSLYRPRKVVALRYGQLYVALAVLERRGVITSGWDPQPKPGHLARRMYWLAPPADRKEP